MVGYTWQQWGFSLCNLDSELFPPFTSVLLSVVLGLATPASPENLLQMQILGLIPDVLNTQRSELYQSLQVIRMHTKV